MKADELWQRCCRKNRIPPETTYQTWAFGGAPDQLAALTILGVKTATASAYDLYALDPDEPVPSAGDYSVILNSCEEAVCVIRTTATCVRPFDQVTEEHAFREGEGDRSLAYWRQVHRDFFQEECRQYHIPFSEQLNVLCEEYTCLYSAFEAAELTDSQAREIVSWRYPGEYAVYDFPEWEECERRGWSLTSAQKRKNAYYAFLSDGEFSGFFHIMDRQDHVELGVGLAPDSCGQHMGHMLMTLALAKIQERYGCIIVQLSVRSFNQRAIRCYENAGFRKEGEYFEADSPHPETMLIMRRTIQ